MIRKHVLISGNVTGVFFRRFIVEHAGELGLKGWVRNLDGKVEAVFEGSRGDVERMIALCWKGSEGARVDAIKVRDEPVQHEKEFR